MLYTYHTHYAPYTRYTNHTTEATILNWITLTLLYFTLQVNDPHDEEIHHLLHY